MIGVLVILSLIVLTIGIILFFISGEIEVNKKRVMDLYDLIYKENYEYDCYKKSRVYALERSMRIIEREFSDLPHVKTLKVTKDLESIQKRIEEL